MDHPIDITDILRKYLQDSASEEERTLLFGALAAEDYSEEDLLQLLDGIARDTAAQPDYDSERWRPVVQQILSRGLLKEMPFVPVRPVRSISFRRWAAACIFILLAAGAYFGLRRMGNGKTEKILSTGTVTITPGREGAILTLSDGSQKVLDSLGTGLVTTQQGANVLLNNGQLVYTPVAADGTEIWYNKMTTPRGREFQLVLPDGSRVWLNAASSIRYPTVFSGKERRVEMSGEAYFEVAPKAMSPFIVTIDDSTEVEVLGTHFNVNAYPNETSQTATLLKGSVRVSAKDRRVLLYPGQQVRVSGGRTAPARVQVIDKADTAKVMAWRNGAFNFEGVSLQEAMRQLERWYDIEVVYTNGVPDVHFDGEIGRNVSLADLLDMLAGTKLKFRVEGRKLIILN